MVWVTIEGSATPCVELPRGQRRTVQLTDYVQRLINGGYAVVIEEATDPPEDDDGGDGADRGQRNPERVAAAGAAADRAVDPAGEEADRPRVRGRAGPRPRDAEPPP